MTSASGAGPGPGQSAFWDRLLGIGLFSFIPLTLYVLLVLPLGAGWSLFLAAAIIALHRPIASRLVFARAGRRCLWCGGTVHQPVRVDLAGVPPLRVCREEGLPLARFLRFCRDRGVWLRLGILAPVLLYFVLGALAAAGVGPVALPHLRTYFRGSIALSVVSVALFYRFSRPLAPERFPFPIHNLALLGVRATLVIFLLVGFYWIGLTVGELWAL